ncbi:MAG: motility protein A [Desulfobacterales bacterium]
MDFATFFGILVAGGLMAGAIVQNGAAGWFVNYPSLMIVIGGTMGATLVAYPLSDIVSVFGVAKKAFLYRTQAPQKLIPQMVNFAKLARKEGVLAFESRLRHLEIPFMARGLRMAVDGMEVKAIEDVLGTEIAYVSARHRLGADIFTTMGTFAPAIGMLGTIIGLVQMLMQMEDPSKIGPAMALALLTTFYGTLLANLFFLPLAGKLKARDKQELLLKQMILEGILAIQRGENHRIVEQKLRAYLSVKTQIA